MKLSAVIITKNEEEMIADCIDSVSFCDEILLVDNGSSDRTVDIAKRMGARVISFDSNDFSALRNFGLKKVSCDYILYVDADERISEELRKNIEKNLDGKTACFKLKRQNFYLGNNPWPKLEEVERLFLRDKLKGWRGNIHESPVYVGENKTAEGLLFHYTHRNLTQMLRKTIEWSDIEAKNRLDAGHPKMSLWRFPKVMISTFFDYYIKQKGYSVGTVGLIESIYQSFSTMITYAKLWELQNKNKSEENL